MKRISTLILCMLLLTACGNAESAETETVSAEQETAETIETVKKEEPDIPADLSFDGASFTFGVCYNVNARNLIVMEELNGEALNDAQYNTIMDTEERLEADISEFLIEDNYPAVDTIRSQTASGDDTIQVANLYCAAVPALLSEGSLIDYSRIPHIDLTKSWWDQNVNRSLILGDMRYAAIGDLSITTHDLTYILLFSKAIVEQNQLESPYDLVNEGRWTLDAMQKMMETVILDANGDGAFTSEDHYGYLGSPKNVLPGFWIGSDIVTIGLNHEGIPEMSLKDERFVNLVDKVFGMMYDSNGRYDTKDNSDVTCENIQMFQENKGLFMDCTLFWVGALREMETDFGILPYPMYDEAQGEYCARVGYFMAPLVPISNQNLEVTGAVLEMANYLASKSLTPAYYEITLKGKYSRHEESVVMLDLIFDRRVVELGDTIFCPDVRDGFLSAMFTNNKRELISNVEANEDKIQAQIDKMIAAG